MLNSNPTNFWYKIHIFLSSKSPNHPSFPAVAQIQEVTHIDTQTYPSNVPKNGRKKFELHFHDDKIKTAVNAIQKKTISIDVFPNNKMSVKKDYCVKREIS